MEKIQSLLIENPETREISLDNQEINDLEELVPLLSNFSNLKELSLTHNRLTCLPEDLSELKSLQVFHLDENPLNSTENFIPGLQSLPSLKHLTMSVPEETEEEVIVTLTNLESFNGTSLTDEVEEDSESHDQVMNDNKEEEDHEFEEEKHQEDQANDEKENSGKELPSENINGQIETETVEPEKVEPEKQQEENFLGDQENTSCEEENDGKENTINEENIEQQDTEQEQEQSDNEGDQDPPKKEPMENQIENNTDMQLQNSEQTNRKLTTPNHDQQPQPEISTSPRNKPPSPPKQQNSPAPEKVKPRQVKLENLMKTENKNELHKKITLHEDDKEDAKQIYLDALNIVGAPRGDFEGFMSDISNQLEALLDGENAISDPLKRYSEVLGAKRRLYDYCFDEIVRASSNFDENLYNSLAKVKQRFGYLFDEYTETVKKMHLQYAKRIRQMQTDLDSADGEITQLLQAAEILEEEAKAHSTQQMKISEEFEKDREALMEEVGWLKVENEKLLNRLRQYDLNRQKISSQIRSPNGLIQTSRTTDNEQETSSIRRGSPQRSQKTMSLRQLKDTIEEIYASKLKFDKKCKDAGAPRETMEQYLYTYLNTKYGLKSLILDWASAIIHAVKRHSDSDVDVKVFAKILRNEIDEEFRLVLKKIKETVAELLKTFIKSKHPLKSDREIHNMFLSKKDGTLMEEEWVDIIKYMYNDEDNANIIMRVRQVIGSKQTGGESPQSRNKIPYEDFIHVLVDFQLRGHERFLSKFTNLFRQVDKDRNGIINEQEFKDLVWKIDPERSEEHLDNQIRQIDPFGNQAITYSDCVSCLTEDIITLIQRD